MLEWVGNFEVSIDDQGRKQRDFISAVSPGVRVAAIDRDNLQFVIGFAFPIGLTRPTNDYGVFMYLSLEHKFLKP